MTEAEKWDLKLATTHWSKMRKWVRKRTPEDEADELVMLQAIKVCWDADFCPLCKLHKCKCTICVLGKKFGKCGGLNDNAWNRVETARTWGDWLVHSDEMLKQLQSLKVRTG